MTWQKLPNFLFSHCKSMETISCHSNQNSYQTETKNSKFFVSPTFRRYLCNIERIDLMASEMSFENVNGRRTDGRQMCLHTTS